MRFLAYLFLSVAAGFGVYSLGAVIWSVLDPHGAGETLLFTIPIALGGMAIPGILGMLCLIFREPPTPKRAARRVTRAVSNTPRRATPAHLPAPLPRPRRALPQHDLHPDLDLIPAV